MCLAGDRGNELTRWESAVGSHTLKADSRVVRASLSSRRIVAVAAILACGALLRGSPQADQKIVKKWTLGRTPDGQPDLQGVWTNYDPTPFEQLTPEEQRPREPAVSTADWLVQDSPISRRRPSMVVDPPNGRVPLKHEAIEQRDAALAIDSSFPGSGCGPAPSMPCGGCRP